MDNLKDTEFDKMKKDLTSQLDSERRENAKKMQDLLNDFKQDMKTVEATHKRKRDENAALTVKLESKVMKQQKVIDELKTLLQMTVKSD